MISNVTAGKAKNDFLEPILRGKKMNIVNRKNYVASFHIKLSLKSFKTGTKQVKKNQESFGSNEPSMQIWVNGREALVLVVESGGKRQLGQHDGGLVGGR